jgi:hypothetical protein
MVAERKGTTQTRRAQGQRGAGQRRDFDARSRRAFAPTRFTNEGSTVDRADQPGRLGVKEAIGLARGGRPSDRVTPRKLAFSLVPLRTVRLH